MKKQRFVLLTLLTLSCALYGDLPQPALQDLSEASTLAETPESSPSPEPASEVKEVGKASRDGMSTAKKRQLQNIGIAVGAVAVATVALILVSRNNGHNK